MRQKRRLNRQRWERWKRAVYRFFCWPQDQPTNEPIIMDWLPDIEIGGEG